MTSHLHETHVQLIAIFVLVHVMTFHIRKLLTAEACMPLDLPAVTLGLLRIYFCKANLQFTHETTLNACGEDIAVGLQGLGPEGVRRAIELEIENRRLVGTLARQKVELAECRATIVELSEQLSTSNHGNPPPQVINLVPAYPRRK